MSKKVLIIIIGVFVLIMGMMGAGFFVLWNQMSNTVAQVQQQNDDDDDDAAEVEDAEEEIVVGPMYKLDTLIVNLADKGGKRYLRVTMELELKVPEEVEEVEVIDEIEKRLPQLRDSILMILPSKQYADISTTEGKVVLRDEIIAKLNANLRLGQVGNIYFTEFVVQ